MNIGGLFNKIVVKATPIVSKVGLCLKRHAPEILTYGGMGLTVTGTVLNCRATLKSKEFIDKARADIQSDPENQGKISKKMVANVAKAYAPGVIIEVAGLIMEGTSTHILRKENIALAVAYATLNEKYKNYRKRMRNAINADSDPVVDASEKNLLSGIETEDGEFVARHGSCAPYSVIFDNVSSTLWRSDPNMSFYHLKSAYHECNDILKIKGHIFLNEVLSKFGFNPCKEGQVLGWVRRDCDELDKTIDMNLFDVTEPEIKAFIDGQVDSIQLDFFPDGNIMYILNPNVRKYNTLPSR